MKSILFIIYLILGVFSINAADNNKSSNKNLRSSEFIKGVDISSVISLEQSGVIFRDFDGNSRDIFETLRDVGINYVRIRVWNNPFTDRGDGYGGGNNDIDTAIKIGVRATKQGMKTYIDFHYSDFWADPSKQKPPKSWQNMNINDKSQALYQYTSESLKKLLDAGVNIGIVQIGNETMGYFCGEKRWNNIALLMNSGTKAVREISRNEQKDIKIAIHFTNPEKKGQYDYYAGILAKYLIDYDIFASSYYSFWHGTPDNLANELRYVSNKYGKQVLCAETSYPYTSQNGDSFNNTISEYTTCAKRYPLTIQGQTDAVRDVLNAISSIGEQGLGVFYWEPAWLPVPGTPSEQKALWELHGSGWASSYATEYDPNDAGRWFGGSSWDNQAMFDFDGNPLSSLSVWLDF